MRIPRVFLDLPLQSGATMELDERAATHVARVLRLRAGAPLVLFNGQDGEFDGVLDEVAKRRVTARIGPRRARDTESPLEITLVQGISKGERMDYTVQKAVELGVSRIVPVFTDHCVVNLSGERRESRLRHWQGVAISACEQCGRTRLPELCPPQALHDYLSNTGSGTRLVLAPGADTSLASAARGAPPLHLLIGPEGGLSEREVAAACAAGYTAVHLGPRVLRTETAAVAALTTLQVVAGDLG